MNAKERYIPQTLQKPVATITYILGIPIFAICFLVLYTPFHLESLLSFPHASYQFNVLICSSIMIVIYTASRTTMCAIRKNTRLTWNWFAFWSAMELVIISLAITLYIWLIGNNDTYLDYFFDTIKVITAINAIPFLIITMAASLRYFEKHLNEEDIMENDRIRFYDDKHNLKLAAQSSMIYYIEAAENYVDIHYKENERMRNFSLRSSMMGIEDLCESHKLLRCHRSYYINPQHIKVLRKEKEGQIFAELDIEDGKRIPVSKRYYDKLVEFL